MPTAVRVAAAACWMRERRPLAHLPLRLLLLKVLKVNLLIAGPPPRPPPPPAAPAAAPARRRPRRRRLQQLQPQLVQCQPAARGVDGAPAVVALLVWGHDAFDVDREGAGCSKGLACEGEGFRVGLVGLVVCGVIGVVW